MNNSIQIEAIELLQKLVAIPSFSKEEDKTADLLEVFLKSKGKKTERHLNNVWCRSKFYDPARATLLLNSHHDTVRPAKDYTHDPFLARLQEGRLYGLGTNDAGASLVSLLFCFLHFDEHKHLPYNLIFAATAEEEISGLNGIASVLPYLEKIDCAIVGEPTGLRLAVAEKGLMVVDCVSLGTAAHAAHDFPNNAIYNALLDLEWIKNYSFSGISNWLGAVKMNVTMIKAGQQHNMIPDRCEFTLDVRSTDVAGNEFILDHIRKHLKSQIEPRSMRLRASSIALSHPLVRAGQMLGIKLYGSPTISDQALLNCPSVKIGPGESTRSHTADEYILIEELENGIRTYIQLVTKLFENEQDTVG
jgi:acetylornithine deacetylase